MKVVMKGKSTSITTPPTVPTTESAAFLRYRPSGARITEEDFALLGYAHDIVELSARAKRRLAGSEVVGGKTLRIGVNDGIEAQALVPALTELRRRDADFDPVIRMGPHSALVEMVEYGRLDVVLEYRDPSGAPAGA